MIILGYVLLWIISGIVGGVLLDHLLERGFELKGYKRKSLSEKITYGALLFYSFLGMTLFIVALVAFFPFKFSHASKFPLRSNVWGEWYNGPVISPLERFLKGIIDVLNTPVGREKMTKKTYDYISLFSGGKLNFLNPSPDQIHIEDIARALSHNCRYTGHVNRFYSVAEHSIRMCKWFWEKEEYEKAYTALMHDATEAYLVDIPRPIKPHLGGYMEMEEKLEGVIFEKYCVDPICEDVKWVDTHIVRDEAEVLFDNPPEWVYDFNKVGIKIPKQAPNSDFMSRCFLSWYDRCWGKLIEVRGE